jgi:hypothetical protein
MTAKTPFNSFFHPTDILETLRVLNAAARERRLKKSSVPAASSSKDTTPKLDTLAKDKTHE